MSPTLDSWLMVHTLYLVGKLVGKFRQWILPPHWCKQGYEVASFQGVPLCRLPGGADDAHGQFQYTVRSVQDVICSSSNISWTVFSPSCPVLQCVVWFHTSDMASLLDIILQSPIQEALVSNLPLGDLLNLSKTNSIVRAALHGFNFGRSDQGLLSFGRSRPALRIGQHNTSYWKNLKSKSLLLCSELHHVRGEKVRGCRMCSMPVCEACIIKASFGKRNERTFWNRIRSLCPDCYEVENGVKILPYHFDPKEKMCICTTKDAHLCIKCKTKRKLEARENLDQCHGEGCLKAQEGGFLGRVCLWCNLQLPNNHDRAAARREYDSRHLLARSYSTYERPSDGHWAEQEALWDSSPYKAKARPLDLFEEQQQWMLSVVSARRSLTRDAAEEERWRRSESLRRLETFNPPPLLRRQRTTPIPESVTWRDTDSIAPTLVERDYWESLDPPAYVAPGHSLDNDNNIPEQK